VIVLDTHALLWAVADDKKLGRKTRQLIERRWGAGEVAVSAISFWEAAVLQQRGRIVLPAAAEAWRVDLLDNGLTELPITGAIAVRAVDLGDLPLDPADRMIVATALIHRAQLVTADVSLLAWRHALVRHDARL
jgi:PIN domain nuclease of toxin-antitoxin system